MQKDMNGGKIYEGEGRLWLNVIFFFGHITNDNANLNPIQTSKRVTNNVLVWWNFTKISSIGISTSAGFAMCLGTRLTNYHIKIYFGV